MTYSIVELGHSLRNTRVNEGYTRDDSVLPCPVARLSTLEAGARLVTEFCGPSASV